MSDQNKGWEMHITEMDLFTGLDLNVMREIADTCCVEENFTKDTVLFKIKDETTVYSLNEQSDIFGWSSMVENSQYTATAVCRETIKVVKIDTHRLNRLFNENPIFGLTVYRRLCGVFNKRLSSIYKRFLTVK